MKKLIAICTIMALIAAMSAGCVNGKKLKEQALAALSQQTKINNYSFSGQAKIKVNTTANAQTPLLSGLMAMLTDGTVLWKGVSATNPVRFEATFTLQPAGLAQSLQIPLLIKDNKMYAHLPNINSEGEFFAINL
ncbi:MAG TPA: hypothetical protein VF260_02485, partial [Bacilli bacterium]